MIDLQRERLISLAEAATLVPAVSGRQPRTVTVWRWCTKGVHGIRLEHVRVGCRTATSRGALRRFLADLAQAVDHNGNGAAAGLLAEPAGAVSLTDERAAAHA